MSKEIRTDSVLLVGDVSHLTPSLREEFDYLKKNFCGQVAEEWKAKEICSGLLYIAGEFLGDLPEKTTFFIKEFLPPTSDKKNVVSLGAVPLLVHGVGVFFRQLFPDKDMFEKVSQAHTFSSLRQSEKSIAYRTGIYMSDVKKAEDGIYFRLMRCSTNFKAPTDNFREIDDAITSQTSSVASHFFNHHVPYNHVLAQIYHNVKVEEKTTDGKKKGASKEKKADISDHADKTKDFPNNEQGEIAFASFYEKIQEFKQSKTDRFDYAHQTARSACSVLTSLRFTLKPKLTTAPKDLPKTFDVLLYPGSVFIIPRSTNRWYRHKTVPSDLSIENIPIRMGYIERPSGRLAKYVDGQTRVLNEVQSEWIPLRKADKEKQKQIHDLYLMENTTDCVMKYPFLDSTLNDGDLLEPLC